MPPYNWPIGKSMGVLPWLMIDVGPCSWTSGPQYTSKKAEQAKEQDSKQHISTASASALASRFLTWIPILNSSMMNCDVEL